MSDDALETVNRNLNIQNCQLVNENATLQAQLAAIKQERDEAEYALQSKGYRKSCDIMACNCGDQWNHGGHAQERLRELRDALPFVNGKTLLTIATDLVEERDGQAMQIDALCTHLSATITERDRLKEAVLWALGYTDFRGRRADEGHFWWRKELRARALPDGISEVDIQAYQAKALRGETGGG